MSPPCLSDFSPQLSIERLVGHDVREHVTNHAFVESAAYSVKTAPRTVDNGIWTNEIVLGSYNDLCRRTLADNFVSVKTPLPMVL